MKIYVVKNIDAFDESLIERCATFFPEWRKEKMLRYRHLRGKVQCALAYMLLIHALRQEGVFDEMPEFYYNEHGKPYLKNYSGWFFSLSHSKTAVCCVLSRVELGVDIEDIGVYKETLTSYICNENEFEYINNSVDKAVDFYKMWTRKEAVFKMQGSGITKGIKEILNTPDIIVESYKIDDMWLSVSYREGSDI